MSTLHSPLDTPPFPHLQDRAFNDVRYYIDSSKLQALGWKCEVSFEDGLKQTIAWYATQLWQLYSCKTDLPETSSNMKHSVLP